MPRIYKHRNLVFNKLPSYYCWRTHQTKTIIKHGLHVCNTVDPKARSIKQISRDCCLKCSHAMILLLFFGRAEMFFTKVFLGTLCISWRICSCFELYTCGLALPLVFLIVIGPINGWGNAAYVLLGILCFHFSSDGARANISTFHFIQIHWSLNCRRLH